MFGIDSVYGMIMLPALILAGLVTLPTRSTFGKYSRQRASSGLTSCEPAYSAGGGISL